MEKQDLDTDTDMDTDMDTFSFSLKRAFHGILGESSPVVQSTDCIQPEKTASGDL